MRFYKIIKQQPQFICKYNTIITILIDFNFYICANQKIIKMNTINVFPKTIEEKNALKAFLESQKIKFDELIDKIPEIKINSDFLESMELSFKEVMSDKIQMREFKI